MIQTDAFGLDTEADDNLQSIARQVRDIASSHWMPPGEILDRMPRPPRFGACTPDMYQLVPALWQMMHAGLVDCIHCYIGGYQPGGDPPYRGTQAMYRWIGDRETQQIWEDV